MSIDPLHLKSSGAISEELAEFCGKDAGEVGSGAVPVGRNNGVNVLSLYSKGTCNWLLAISSSGKTGLKMHIMAEAGILIVGGLGIPRHEGYWRTDSVARRGGTAGVALH